ncbi:MAG TPA: hypothetical protein ENJ83_03435 [Rhodospirillales bacterium]|nr:hypothetical protein [Rhodospirillales bacterium]
MIDTMHLVCLQETGHVLAALAAETSGDPPALEAVVGDQLHLASARSTEDGTAGLAAATTLVPVSLLELKSAPFDRRVLANPLHHAMDGGRVVQLPPLLTPAAPSLNDELTLTLNGGTLDTRGFSVVARAGDPADQLRVQSGKFIDADGNGTADPLVLPLTIMPGDTPAAIEAPGDYDIFVALEGMRPYWASDALP